MISMAVLKTECPKHILHCHNLAIMNSMQTCNSVMFYFMKNSFPDVSRRWILPNMIRAVPILIIFGRIHLLLTSENEFFMKQNVTELQVCMEFMLW